VLALLFQLRQTGRRSRVARQLVFALLRASHSGVYASDGDADLARALEAGDDLAAVERLITAGVGVNRTNDHGKTPLMLAAGAGRAEIAAALLRVGAHVNDTNPDISRIKKAKPF